MQIPKWSAAGVDGQTVEAAKKSFDGWMEPMLQSIHRQGYRAPDIRRVYIPKPGKTLMLELLMTRQNPLDRAVIANAHGLEFIVLDELHTYRGRQGADVAMLVRRVGDRLCPDHQPICIGTSATMASEGSESDRAIAVASVASRLFGTTISADAVIDESLARATDPALKPANLGDALAAAIDAELNGFARGRLAALRTVRGGTNGFIVRTK